MDHNFENRIVNKGKRVRKCFGCYSKIEVGESQEVRKGVYGGEFIEDRVCMKCSRLIKKHRCKVENGDGVVTEGVIHELLGEFELKTHEELELYFDNK